MDIQKTISTWQERLGMEHMVISLEPIDREQVMFPDDMKEEDRDFVGIDKKTGVISHDRDLTEEDILHEMLHYGFPQASEEFVNNMTGQLMETFCDV